MESRLAFVLAQRNLQHGEQDVTHKVVVQFLLHVPLFLHVLLRIQSNTPNLGAPETFPQYCYCILGSDFY